MKNASFTLIVLSLLLLLSCGRMVNHSKVTVPEPVLSTVEEKPDPALVPETLKKEEVPTKRKVRAEDGEIKLTRSSAGLISPSYDAYDMSSAPSSYSWSYGDGSSADKAPVRSGSFTSASYLESTSNAGILTAGELHDFSKWNLWTDIATDALGQYQKAWDIRPMERYGAQVTNDKGRPVVDATVELLSGEAVVWTAKTDNTGKAELWADLYEKKEYFKKPEYTLRVKYDGKTQSKGATAFSDNGLTYFSFSSACNISNTVDAMFVVDATGSMGDEINYLKSELNSIIGKFKQENKDLTLRVGSVFYRDTVDEYLTRESDFSDDPFKTIDFIQGQNANGGGDFPEAVDAALAKAMNMSWSPNARTRLLFLVLDAPPHDNPQTKARLWKSINEAAKKGIRIIPITASGIDKATEYLMRSFALATNGTYVFLTNHSGVGGDHIEPTTDSYDVEKLNDLLVRLFTQFTYAPDCSGQVSSEMPDTSRIFSILTNVPADSNNLLIVSADTSPNTNPIIKDTSITKINPVDPPKEEALVYYPNPTHGLLNVEVVSDMKEVYLADVSGKLIDKYVVNEGGKIKMRLDNFPAGMYFLKCEVNGKWLSGKVILVR